MKAWTVLFLIFISSCSITQLKSGGEKVAILYADGADAFQKISAELGSRGCQQSSSIVTKAEIGMFAAMSPGKSFLARLNALKNEATKTSSNVVLSSLVNEVSGNVGGMAYFCPPNIASQYLANKPYPAPFQ